LGVGYPGFGSLGQDVQPRRLFHTLLAASGAIAVLPLWGKGRVMVKKFGKIFRVGFWMVRESYKGS